MTTGGDQRQAAVWVRYHSPAGRWVLLVTVLGSGLVALDATVVNVALPTIAQAFGAGLTGLQWIVNAYTLTLAALLLLGGALGDRYGRRRLFVTGILWFAAASLVCAIAPNTPTLIGARALQGIGAALLTPGTLAIIETTFHPDDRSAAIGAWAGLGGVLTAIGPVVGGYLTTALSWRLIFLINLPLAPVHRGQRDHVRRLRRPGRDPVPAPDPAAARGGVVRSAVGERADPDDDRDAAPVVSRRPTRAAGGTAPADDDRAPARCHRAGTAGASRAEWGLLADDLPRRGPFRGGSLDHGRAADRGGAGRRRPRARRYRCGDQQRRRAGGGPHRGCHLAARRRPHGHRHSRSAHLRDRISRGDVGHRHAGGGRWGAQLPDDS